MVATASVRQGGRCLLGPAVRRPARREVRTWCNRQARAGGGLHGSPWAAWLLGAVLACATARSAEDASGPAMASLAGAPPAQRAPALGLDLTGARLASRECSGGRWAVHHRCPVPPLQCLGAAGARGESVRPHAAPRGVAQLAGLVASSCVALPSWASREPPAADTAAWSLVAALAALLSLAQLWHMAPWRGPRASEAVDGIFGPGRWAGRVLGMSFFWLFDSWYSFTQAPGELFGGYDQSLILAAIFTPFSGAVPALFTAVFFFLGIWPAIYCAVLLPGARGQALPAGPFVWSSFVLGAYGLAPYLAARQLRGARDPQQRGAPGDEALSVSASPTSALDEAGLAFFESPISGAFLLLAGLLLAAYGLGNGAFGTYAPSDALAHLVPVFQTSAFAHLCCLDFLVLWAFFAPVLLEDGQRRGRFVEWTLGDVATFAACAGVPCLGGALWLLVRPKLGPR